MSDSHRQALARALRRNVYLDRLIPEISALLKRAPLCVLNLGCGRRPIPGAVNLDVCFLPDIAVNADIRRALPFRSNAFDAAIAWSVLEHLSPEELHMALEEIARVCEDGAAPKVHVPYFSSESAFSTIDHKTFFAYNTFWRYREGDMDPTSPKLFSQDMQVRLVWHTHRLLRPLNSIVMPLVNACPPITMFYQHFLSWAFPMRAIDVVCIVKKQDNTSTRQGTSDH